MWSDADKKEKEELFGLEIFLDLKDIGELGKAPVGEGFMKLLFDKDGLTRFDGLTSWQDPCWTISGVSFESLGRLDDILK